MFATSPRSGEADVDAACQAAATAFESWRDTTPSERQRALLRFADLVEAHADELVALESENTGKPLGLTADEEVPPMVDQIRFFAGAARVLEGTSAGEYLAGHTSWIRREPIGVCAQVTPWNYPMMMAIWKIAPALAAGNTVVLKPSDTTPVSTLRLAELAAEVFPDGVLNVICGDRDTGAALVAHQIPQMVSITGSVRAGMEVMRSAADDLKNVHLELGGKAPVLVFDDADIEAAAEAIAIAGYFNAGQDCTAATRVIAAPGIHDDLAAALAEQATGHTTGPPSNADADYGPAQQRQPARPGQRLRRPGARATPRCSPAAQQVGDAGLLLRPHRGRRPPPGRRDHPERDLRPGHHRAALRRRGRGRPLGQRRRVRPGVQRLHHRPRPGPAGVAPARLRLRVDQHPHPAGGRDAPRRLQALGHRQGPLHVRARGLHPHQARHVGLLMQACARWWGRAASARRSPRSRRAGDFVEALVVADIDGGRAAAAAAAFGDRAKGVALDASDAGAVEALLGPRAATC